MSSWLDWVNLYHTR